MGWIYWDKLIGGDFSDGELVWTSFEQALRKFTYSYHKDTKGGHTRIHPTQKPIAAYKYCLEYAKIKPGQTILDTHGGSMSIAIACYDLGHPLDLWELDEDYFKAGVDRVKKHISQGQLFRPQVKNDPGEQTKLL